MFSNRQYRQSIDKVSALINKKARPSWRREARDKVYPAKNTQKITQNGDDSF
jgi:hypothetical protein